MSRIRPRLLATLMLVTLAAGAVETAPPQALDWGDLIPPPDQSLQLRGDHLRQRYSALDADQAVLYSRVKADLDLRAALAAENRTLEGLRPEERKLYEAAPSENYPDIVAFWREVDELQKQFTAADQAVRADINGQKVQIPGYILPLEFEGKAVSEFLLVPFVGACIHTPPPPANQIVHVKLSQAFENEEGMFAPVRVEGTMLTQGKKHDFHFVDGRGAVNAGYTLIADKVELYED